MDINTLRIAATVASFVTFIGILAWAYAGRNKAALEAAGRIPFAQEPGDAP